MVRPDSAEDNEDDSANPRPLESPITVSETKPVLQVVNNRNLDSGTELTQSSSREEEEKMRDKDEMVVLQYIFSTILYEKAFISPLPGLFFLFWRFLLWHQPPPNQHQPFLRSAPFTSTPEPDKVRGDGSKDHKGRTANVSKKNNLILI